MLSAMELVFVTREGCGLCEKAERALWALGVPYLRRDVDRDPELFARYPSRVRVRFGGGGVLRGGALGERELVEVAARLGGGTWTR